MTAALLAVCAARACARRLPAELQIDAFGEVAAFGRTGRLLARGRVTGHAHWSSLLLVLSVGQGARRGRPLLIPADALDAASFSALSVLARTAGAAGGFDGGTVTYRNQRPARERYNSAPRCIPS